MGHVCLPEGTAYHSCVALDSVLSEAIDDQRRRTLLIYHIFI